jgi:hypothetical protein
MVHFEPSTLPRFAERLLPHQPRFPQFSNRGMRRFPAHRGPAPPPPLLISSLRAEIIPDSWYSHISLIAQIPADSSSDPYNRYKIHVMIEMYPVVTTPAIAY